MEHTITIINNLIVVDNLLAISFFDGVLGKFFRDGTSPCDKTEGSGKGSKTEIALMAVVGVLVVHVVFLLSSILPTLDERRNPGRGFSGARQLGHESAETAQGPRRPRRQLCLVIAVADQVLAQDSVSPGLEAAPTDFR